MEWKGDEEEWRKERRKKKAEKKKTGAEIPIRNKLTV